MGQVPDTFPGLFWGYSAIFLIFGLYILRLGKLIKGISAKLSEIESSRSQQKQDL